MDDPLGTTHEDTFQWQARDWPYERSEDEVWMDGIRPDVVLFGAAEASAPFVLVEIRVRHAVDEHKSATVKARDWAMVEIDLSRLSAEELGDARFEDLVLNEETNRHWIHSPLAEQEFLAFERQFQVHVEEAYQAQLARNAALEREKHKRAEAKAAARARQAKFRQEKRAPYEEDLRQLNEATSESSVQSKLANLWRRDEKRVVQLHQRYFPDQELPHFLRKHHRQAWIFNAHPQLWQLALCVKFLLSVEVGSLVNTRRWMPEVLRTFGCEPFVLRLFNAQQEDTKRKKQAGYQHYGRYRAWFFEQSENELIPSPFEVITYLINQLVHNAILEETPRLGEYRLRLLPGSTASPYGVTLGWVERSPIEELLRTQGGAKAPSATFRTSTSREPTRGHHQTSLVTRRKWSAPTGEAALVSKGGYCLECQVCQRLSSPDHSSCSHCGSILLFRKAVGP